MATVLSDRAATVVTCVHGTWARGSRWPEVEASVRAVLDGSLEFRYFEWSGRNSLRDRMRAAINLRRLLQHDASHAPRSAHLLIAHSHGAGIVLHALAGADRRVTDSVHGIVLLSPSLLTSELVVNPINVANRLLLGAVAVVPLLIVGWLSLAPAIGLDRPSAWVASLLIVALWLALFRPSMVKRRAEMLASQLMLPRIDLPGLIIRAPGDEVSAAFSSIATFERVAHFVRSRILDARGFEEHPDRRLREARTWRELARALFEACSLVPMSVTFWQVLHDATTQRHWLLATVLLPLVIVLTTGALAIVGGAMLLLLLLPASSFLLWPFGIFPTAAAALLTVSVESSPTPAWRVIQLPRSSVVGSDDWRHSTHQNRAALEALSAYVRQNAGVKSLALGTLSRWVGNSALK